MNCDSASFKIRAFVFGILAVLLANGCTPHENSTSTAGQHPTNRNSKNVEDKLDVALITQATGQQATANAETGAVRIEFPRKELNVTVGGSKIPPAFGLMAWAAFTGTNTNAILIGEVPLLEAEVNGFLDRAVEAGLEVTALHNTFLWDQPRVFSLHFGGSGTVNKLSVTVGALFKLLGENRLSSAPAAPPRTALLKTTLDPKIITKYLWKGEQTDGAYRITIGRGTRLAGVAVGDSMGVSTWAAFAGSNEQAVVDGDLAVLEYELHDVLKTLIGAKFNIVSIHTHLIKETPKIIFVHFWGTGTLLELTRGLRAALDLEKTFRGST